jgi:hypothetical protein
MSFSLLSSSGIPLDHSSTACGTQDLGAKSVPIVPDWVKERLLGDTPWDVIAAARSKQLASMGAARHAEAGAKEKTPALPGLPLKSALLEIGKAHDLAAWMADSTGEPQWRDWAGRWADSLAWVEKQLSESPGAGTTGRLPQFQLTFGADLWLKMAAEARRVLGIEPSSTSGCASNATPARSSRMQPPPRRPEPTAATMRPRPSRSPAQAFALAGPPAFSLIDRAGINAAIANVVGKVTHLQALTCNWDLGSAVIKQAIDEVAITLHRANGMATAGRLDEAMSLTRQAQTSYQGALGALETLKRGADATPAPTPLEPSAPPESMVFEATAEASRLEPTAPWMSLPRIDEDNIFWPPGDISGQATPSSHPRTSRP